MKKIFDIIFEILLKIFEKSISDMKCDMIGVISDIWILNKLTTCDVPCWCR